MDRFAHLKPFYVMELLERAQQLEALGENVIHLEIGEPDFDTPDCTKQAALQAMNDGQTHYTHCQGIPELRQAICGHYETRYGVDIDPEQVLVTSGTSPAMLLVFKILCEHWANVIIPDPGYACYASFVQVGGGMPVPVPVFAKHGFHYDPAVLKDQLDDSVAAVMVNSPSNPAGTVIRADLLKKICAICTERDIPIVSDEVYHGLEYGIRAASVLEFTDKAFVLNGFSKLYAMTGWRLGYLIAPMASIPTLRKLAQNLFICAGSVAQWAGLAAMNNAADEVAAMHATYDKRRKYLVDRLPSLGFTIPAQPDGAFYVWADARKFSNDSLAFCHKVLDDAKVAMTPGIDFGARGEGFVRISYANSLENIAEGLDRLEAYLSEWGE